MSIDTYGNATHGSPGIFQSDTESVATDFPSTFNHVIAGEYATSYVSLKHAEQILHGNPAWDKLSEMQKQITLEQATMQIDTLRFFYNKYDCRQSLQFPRDEHVKDGAPYIPHQVIYATCEQVKQLLDTTSNDRAQAIADGVTSRKIGDVSESYGSSKGGTGSAAANGQLIISAQAKGYLRGFISRIGHIVNSEQFPDTGLNSNPIHYDQSRYLS